jgi:hypothetical protein
MTSREYAAELQSIAGAITALCETNLPCAKECAAHPVQVQTTILQAKAHAATAAFWGNGGINEIADATCAKLDGKRTPSVSEGASPWAWFIGVLRTNPVARQAVTISAIALITSLPTCASRAVNAAAEAAVKQAQVAAHTAQAAARQTAVVGSNVNAVVSMLVDQPL